MKKEKEDRGIIAVVVLICIVCVVALFGRKEDTDPKCMKGYCDNERAVGSYYCYTHKSYSGGGSGSASTSGYDSSSGSGTSKSTTDFGSTSSSKKDTLRTSTSKKSSSPSSWPTYSSYDEGYDAVYEHDDYDWDRYWSDSDYANGVEDAMDELDW